MTRITGVTVEVGWIFYDARCGGCRFARRLAGPVFAARGFRWVPLQTPGAADRLGIDSADFDLRFHLLLADGRVLDNADALAALCRAVGWLRPLGVLLSLPGVREGARWAYDALARNRYCGTGAGWRVEGAR